MPGSIDNLFGNVSTLENADSAVSKLFSAENNRPVDRLSLNKKLRTVLNDGNEQTETSVTEPVQEPIETNDTTEETTAQDTATVTTTANPHLEARVIDTKEIELEKANRTLFVGNITTDVITSKQTYKEFKSLFTKDPLKVESIRFRSISFDEPLPRKVAFVKQKLHSLRDAVNAYVVFSNAASKTQLQHLVSSLNGTVFKKRHLRVDSVTHPAPHSNTRSVFIGNLDFEEDEESLWRHFGKCGAIEYVRIVRDSRTNIGKGFAYVQFKELESVSKALLLDGKVMVSVHADDSKDGKSSKRWSRELRVTRCRNMKKDIKGSNRGKKLRTKAGNSGLTNLNETQKTKIGRANKVLGKADRATLGRELTIEGMRASKNDNVANVLSRGKHKKPGWKTGRVTKRSQAYKKAHGSK